MLMLKNVQNVRRNVKTKRASKGTKAGVMAKETPGDRLKKLREEKGYADAKHFASAVGVNHRTYLAHEKNRGLMRSVKRYADFLGVSVDDIVSVERQPGPKQKYPQPMLAIRPIEVLSSADLNQIKTVSEMLKLKSNEAVGIAKIEKIGPKARGFKVDDDSMVDIARRHDVNIRIGEVVIFDPEQKPVNGKFVLARLHNPERTVLRQYGTRIDADKKLVVRLIPLNPYFQEDTIATPEDGVILGRVVKRYSDL